MQLAAHALIFTAVLQLFRGSTKLAWTFSKSALVEKLFYLIQFCLFELTIYLALAFSCYISAFYWQNVVKHGKYGATYYY